METYRAQHSGKASHSISPPSRAVCACLRYWPPNFFGGEGVRARTVCNVPGCPNLAISGGRCAEHQRESWAGRRGFAGYNTDWLKLRAAVLREEPRCRLCGKPAVTVDHIAPKARGGTDARSNLQSLCDSCRKTKDKHDAAVGKRLNRGEW